MLTRTIYKFIPGIIWWTITFWLFTLPGSAIPKFDLFHQLQGDKLVHAFLFAVLVLLFLYPLQRLVQHKKNRLIIAMVVVMFFCLYGTAIEFIQRDYIENRSFDLGDIIADCVGCFIAFAYAYKKWLA